MSLGIRSLYTNTPHTEGIEAVRESSKNLSISIIIQRLILTLNNFVLTGVKDTHREKSPSNKILTLTKSINMDIWVVGTSRQLFVNRS